MNMAEVIVAIFLFLALMTFWNFYTTSSLRDLRELHLKENELLQMMSTSSPTNLGDHESPSRIHHP